MHDLSDSILTKKVIGVRSKLSGVIWELCANPDVHTVLIPAAITRKKQTAAIISRVKPPKNFHTIISSHVHGAEQPLI
jgi:hypothetical protein